jgi:hypothetical protein
MLLIRHILILVIVLNRGISIIYHIMSRQRKLLRTWLPLQAYYSCSLTHITVYEVSWKLTGCITIADNESYNVIYERATPTAVFHYKLMSAYCSIHYI